MRARWWLVGRVLSGVGLAGCIAVLAALLPSSAVADTTLGGTFAPQSGTPCTVNTAILQAADDGSPSYAAPTAGIITSWSTQPDAITGTGMARLKVYRLSSGTTWTVVGESTIQTLMSNVVNTFTTSIPVNAGDRIAILTTSGSFNCGAAAPSANVVGFGDGTDHPAGSSETFIPTPAFHVDLSAVLSPSCSDPAGAFNQGFNSGFNSGFNPGFNAGFNSGFNAGFHSGFNAGFKARHHRHHSAITTTGTRTQAQRWRPR